MKEVTLNSLREGSIVKVATAFGSGHRSKTAEVTEVVEKDVKNGLPGICYTANGKGGWAYLTHITRVVRY